MRQMAPQQSLFMLALLAPEFPALHLSILTGQAAPDFISNLTLTKGAGTMTPLYQVAPHLLHHKTSSNNEAARSNFGMSSGLNVPRPGNRRVHDLPQDQG